MLRSNIVSIDLDNLLPAIDNKPELWDDFVALGYYCNAKNIPFFVLTNRTQLESLKRIRNAVAASDDKHMYEACYRQTLGFAKTKIKDAGLEVIYCTTADAANAKNKNDELESYCVTSFEEKILLDAKKYCDDEKEFAEGNEAWEGDKVEVVKFYTRRSLDDKNVEQEAKLQEEKLQETLHANKKQHFLFIQKKLAFENNGKARLFHIDHSQQACAIIDGIEETRDHIQRRSSVNKIDQDEKYTPGFSVKPFFTARADERSVRATFIAVSAEIGLKSDAEKLLQPDSRLYVRDWLLNLSLIKFLVDTQSANIVRVLELVSQFENDCLPCCRCSMNENQFQIWHSLKSKVETMLSLQKKAIEQIREHVAVEDFFKQYDLEKNKKSNWFFRMLNFFGCFKLFQKSEWPDTQEERATVTIKDIILHAMKDPTDAYGEGGNRTAQVLYKMHHLIVEQDPDRPRFAEFSHVPNEVSENTLLFHKTWYEYRQFEERKALSLFYQLRAKQLPAKSQVARTVPLQERKNQDVKPKPALTYPAPTERSLVSLVEATKTSWGTRVLAGLRVPGFFSGNYSYSIFSNKQGNGFGVDTRNTSKTSETLTQDIIESVRLTRS